MRKYYQEIQTLPAQDTKDFKDFLDDENSLHQGEFNTMAAVEQLWSYVKQVRFEQKVPFLCVLFRLMVLLLVS